MLYLLVSHYSVFILCTGIKTRMIVFIKHCCLCVSSTESANEEIICTMWCGLVFARCCCNNSNSLIKANFRKAPGDFGLRARTANKCRNWAIQVWHDDECITTQTGIVSTFLSSDHKISNVYGIASLNRVGNFMNYGTNFCKCITCSKLS